MYVHECTRMYVCTYVYVCTHMCVCMFTYVHVCTFVYMYVHTFTYIYIRSMCTYRKVIPGVVSDLCSDLYVNCTTPKLVIHTSNILYRNWPKQQVCTTTARWGYGCCNYLCGHEYSLYTTKICPAL